LNIAIFTPSQNPYSETFIQAHKLYLKDKVFYYYGSGQNIKLENYTALQNRYDRLFSKIKCKLFNKPYHYIWSNTILKSLKKHNVNSVLVEYGTHAYSLLPVLKKLNIPIVVHFHGFDASKKETISRCNNYTEVFKYATKVIAVSKVMYNKLLEIGCPKEKLVYNVYGPQPEFHNVKTSFSKKQFIGIGRFTDKKAPYYTIMAFKNVLEKHPDAKLFLAGKGALLNTCQNLVKTFGIENNVTFLGVVTPDEYRQYLSESLAFVQHSITTLDGDMEGTPLAILEASAAGLPIISTIHAGIPDVIKHGKTGLLCNEHDLGTMTEYMIQCLDDKTLAMQLGGNGKIHIAKHFNLERHINALQQTLS
jgi:glycosyltransferase involved in cell wall biosynthesis